MSISFPLAPMSPVIRGLTIALLLLPVFIGLFGVISRKWFLIIIFFFFLILYSFVWLWCRPSEFVVTSNQLKIVFPAWTRKIPIQDLYNIRILSKENFQQEYGFSVRIGVGGLWGGFGWLWTQKQGFLEFYVSQTANFVLIKRYHGNNLLLTPSKMEEMGEIIQKKINNST